MWISENAPDFRHEDANVLVARYINYVHRMMMIFIVNIATWRSCDVWQLYAMSSIFKRFSKKAG